MRTRKQHDEAEHIDETWLIPYADMLTLLLALFIVLFAASSIDAHKYEQIMLSFNTIFTGGTSIFQDTSAAPLAKPGIDIPKDSPGTRKSDTDDLDKKMQREAEDFRELKRQIDQYIKENGLSTELDTILNHDRLVLTIRDNALFASGSATIKKESRDLAVAISQMLSNYPQYEVEVAGHTDDRPISTFEFESNWELSWKRAHRFMKILLENNQLDPSNFYTIGYGEFRPIGTNDAEEGRALNRRVEVSIIRQFKLPEKIEMN